MRRVTNAKSQELIEAGKARDAIAREVAAKIAQDATDAEDRLYTDREGRLTGLFIRLFRKRIALFVKGLVATANDRGIITMEQGREIIRSCDNRLWPEGRK